MLVLKTENGRKKQKMQKLFRTLFGADVRKVPFCSPAENEGEKMFPKAREVKCLKKLKRMLLDVFYHKLLT